jgi:hypothetical protein
VSDPQASLRAARRDYFERNGFGADGGYGARWVKVPLGPVTTAFPNTAARVRAVRYHDLHHVVTGYATDLVGEAEIAAWELASGCRGFVAAWVLNLSALAIGLALAPKALLRAFVRGRRTRNLYGASVDDALLDARVETVRARLGLDHGPLHTSAGDRLAFTACCGLAVATLLGQLALLAAPLVGLALLWL